MRVSGMSALPLRADLRAKGRTARRGDVKDRGLRPPSPTYPAETPKKWIGPPSFVTPIEGPKGGSTTRTSAEPFTASRHGTRPLPRCYDFVEQREHSRMASQ